MRPASKDADLSGRKPKFSIAILPKIFIIKVWRLRPKACNFSQNGLGSYRREWVRRAKPTLSAGLAHVN